MAITDVFLQRALANVRDHKDFISRAVLAEMLRTDAQETGDYSYEVLTEGATHTSVTVEVIAPTVAFDTISQEKFNVRYIVIDADPLQTRSIVWLAKQLVKATSGKLILTLDNNPSFKFPGTLVIGGGTGEFSLINDMDWSKIQIYRNEVDIDQTLVQPGVANWLDPTVAPYNAVGDGVTDDSAAIVSASASGRRVYMRDSRSHVLGTAAGAAINLATRFVFDPGTRLKPASGVTATLDHLPDADFQVFDGDGKIRFNRNKVLSGHVNPAWWGLIENDSSGAAVTQNTKAIQAAINSAAHAKLELTLPSGHYYVDRLFFNYDAMLNPDYPSDLLQQGRMTIRGQGFSAIADLVNFVTGSSPKPTKRTVLEGTSTAGPPFTFTPAVTGEIRAFYFENMTFVGNLADFVINFESTTQTSGLRNCSVLNRHSHGSGIRFLDNFLINTENVMIQGTPDMPASNGTQGSLAHTSTTFSDDGRDFLEFETTSGNAVYAIAVLFDEGSGNLSHSYGYVGAVSTTTNPSDTVTVYTDIARTTTGWNGHDPTGKTPADYRLRRAGGVGMKVDHLNTPGGLNDFKQVTCRSWNVGFQVQTEDTVNAKALSGNVFNSCQALRSFVGMSLGVSVKTTRLDGCHFESNAWTHLWVRYNSTNTTVDTSYFEGGQTMGPGGIMLGDEWQTTAPETYTIYSSFQHFAANECLFLNANTPGIYTFTTSTSSGIVIQNCFVNADPDRQNKAYAFDFAGRISPGMFFNNNTHANMLDIADFVSKAQLFYPALEVRDNASVVRGAFYPAQKNLDSSIVEDRTHTFTRYEELALCTCDATNNITVSLPDAGQHIGKQYIISLDTTAGATVTVNKSDATDALLDTAGTAYTSATITAAEGYVIVRSFPSNDWIIERYRSTTLNV